MINIILMVLLSACLWLSCSKQMESSVQTKEHQNNESGIGSCGNCSIVIHSGKSINEAHLGVKVSDVNGLVKETDQTNRVDDYYIMSNRQKISLKVFDGSVLGATIIIDKDSQECICIDGNKTTAERVGKSPEAIVGSHCFNSYYIVELARNERIKWDSECLVTANKSICSNDELVRYGNDNRYVRGTGRLSIDPGKCCRNGGIGIINRIDGRIKIEIHNDDFYEMLFRDLAEEAEIFKKINAGDQTQQ